MKKLILALPIAYIFFMVSVTCHPGRLDKNNGHYVRTPYEGYTVGEYHYHDGDGSSSSTSSDEDDSEKYYDCDGNYSRNYGGNYGGNYSRNYSSRSNIKDDSSEQTPSIDFWQWVGLAFLCLCIFDTFSIIAPNFTFAIEELIGELVKCIFLGIKNLIVGRTENKKNSEEQQRIREQQQKIRAQQQLEYDLTRANYMFLYGGDNIMLHVNLPPNTEIGEDNLPRIVSLEQPSLFDIAQESNQTDWGTTYTVYVSKKGSRYHSREGCSRAYTKQHLYIASIHYDACKFCCKTTVDFGWYDEYLKIYHIKKKYGID